MTPIRKASDRLLTFREVCKLLRIHPSTLRRMMEDGEIPTHRVRKSLRFWLSDVRAVVKPTKPDAPPRQPSSLEVQIEAIVADEKPTTEEERRAATAYWRTQDKRTLRETIDRLLQEARP